MYVVDEEKRKCHRLLIGSKATRCHQIRLKGLLATSELTSKIHLVAEQPSGYELCEVCFEPPSTAKPHPRNTP